MSLSLTTSIPTEGARRSLSSDGSARVRANALSPASDGRAEGERTPFRHFSDRKYVTETALSDVIRSQRRAGRGSPRRTAVGRDAAQPAQGRRNQLSSLRHFSDRKYVTETAGAERRAKFIAKSGARQPEAQNSRARCPVARLTVRFIFINLVGCQSSLDDR
jgi:hypothetical protein